MHSRVARNAFLGVFLIVAGALAYWGVSAHRAPVATATPPIPVIAARATMRDFPIWLSAVGTVQSPNVGPGERRSRRDLHDRRGRTAPERT